MMSTTHPKLRQLKPAMLHKLRYPSCMQRGLADSTFSLLFSGMDRLTDFQAEVNSCDYLFWPILLQEP